MFTDVYNLQIITKTRPIETYEKSSGIKLNSEIITPKNNAEVNTIITAITSKMLENIDSASECPDVALSLQKPRDKEGGITVMKKIKSGEVEQNERLWFNCGLDHNQHLMLRAKELLRGIKKRPAPDNMITEKQMELTTKLAQFEEVCDEMEMEKEQAEAVSLCKILKPADWVFNPTPKPHWSTLEGRVSIAADDDAGSEASADSLEAAPAPRSGAKQADSLKHMRMECSAATLRQSWARAAAGAGLQLQARTLPHGTVAFSRLHAHHHQGAVQCLRMLHVMAARAAAALLAAAGSRAGGSALLRRLAALPRGQLTLVILDTDGYFKKGKWKEELELAITDMMVRLECDCVLVTSSNALAELLVQHARSLRDEPRKLARRGADEQAEFYMRGDNRRCVAVDQQGNGLQRLWQQMLQVLPGSSLESARSLAAAYPSPRQLTQAVRSADGVQTLGVARSAAAGARARRLGPGAARRLHALLTGDGDTLVH